METKQKFSFKVAERPEKGKSAVRRLRKTGKIPAIIYGHHPPTPISLPEREFMYAFPKISENVIVDLVLGKEHIDVLLKAYDQNYVKRTLIHVDFYAIERGKKLRTHVPLHVVGSSSGVRAGGILETPMHELEVECLPRDIPEHIEIDVTELELNSALHVRDIIPPKGVEFLSNADQVVVQVLSARVEEVEEEIEEDEEAAEQPE